MRDHEAVKRGSEIIYFASEVQTVLTVIPINTDCVSSTYLICSEKIGEWIDNMPFNRQLETLRVIVLFRGVQENSRAGTVR